MSDSPYLRIPVEAVTLGMYIHALCGAWTDHPFWSRRFLLERPEDLQRLRESSVREVLIDPRRGLSPLPVVAVSPAVEAALLEVPAPPMPIAAAVLAAPAPAPVPKAPAPRIRLDAELARARKLCARSRQAVMAMFSDARMGQAVSAEQAQLLVTEITASVERHPNALISLLRLKTADEYTYLHSVAVCALMVALARQLGLDESLAREAGLAGLLHDVGKMSVPMDVLNKPGQLDEQEFAQVREHPRRGVDILLRGRQVGALVLDVCMHHHEKLDGTGYPHHLAGEQISLFARMGAICDIYDAITSDRPYKAGWDPAESIRRMTQWCGGHLDEAVFRAFVKCLGIYPVGSLVRLQSERLAIVTDQHPDSLLAPLVTVFYSIRTRSPIPQEELDLAQLAGRERIVGRESPAQWGFRNLDRIWSGMERGRRSLFDG
ncbi:MAG: Cyclic di-GMP phosphodiesterase [Stenotrophomonas maltophilia]|nr:MAG: Cyclic di-GMP phosphodiesterase [Stenotrophomonas maltophilia]